MVEKSELSYCLFIKFECVSKSVGADEMRRINSNTHSSREVRSKKKAVKTLLSHIKML